MGYVANVTNIGQIKTLFFTAHGIENTMVDHHWWCQMDERRTLIFNLFCLPISWTYLFDFFMWARIPLNLYHFGIVWFFGYAGKSFWIVNLSRWIGFECRFIRRNAVDFCAYALRKHLNICVLCYCAPIKILWRVSVSKKFMLTAASEASKVIIVN